jgi:hypothetical protein
MKKACTRCGGTGKQFEYKTGIKTKKLIPCRQCKGVGWFEADPIGTDNRPRSGGYIVPQFDR